MCFDAVKSKATCRVKDIKSFVFGGFSSRFWMLRKHFNTYEVVATIDKSPIFFDDDGHILDWVEETEPNDDAFEAIPLRNGVATAWQELRGGVRSLWGKLSGGPGAYEGQWELLRRTYEALDSGSEPPIPADRIRAVNRLVCELSEQARAACGS